ncbi:MAG: FAD:protein FMN transferase, partial [Planctomycetota bacterium]
PETAEVVAYAQVVSEATDGAFDVTVGPLVNAWSFGSTERTRTIPSDASLQELRSSVGYQKLAVRIDPPALRKSIPELQVDLSSIAKGHGVDRVVELLARLGFASVFVEIGGEVRTTGNKAGQPWRVGIQMPDAELIQGMAVHPLTDRSMATSGDYRNRYEVDGVMYSHTIDPRTAKPITHDLASVTVIADTCMEADAWATALNVLGYQAGIEKARTMNDLSVLLVQRTGDAGYELLGTGDLAKFSKQSITAVTESATATGFDFAALTPIWMVTGLAFGLVLTGMAVGVMFGRKAIGGSCGGLNSQTNPDGTSSCTMCGSPSEACKELKQKMEDAKA